MTNWDNFDFSKVEVKEFKPRIIDPNACKHQWEIKYENTGRIESSTCIKCGDKVWS